MARKKVATQLLVSPHTYTRIKALALVRVESQAEVSRTALEGGGLPALEALHTTELEELREGADRVGMGVEDLVDRMVDDGLTLFDLEGLGHYPTPEEWEARRRADQEATAVEREARKRRQELERAEREAWREENRRRREAEQAAREALEAAELEAWREEIRRELLREQGVTA